MKPQSKAVDLGKIQKVSVGEFGDSTMANKNYKAVKFSDLEACPDVPDCGTCKVKLMERLKKTNRHNEYLFGYVNSASILIAKIGNVVDNMPFDKTGKVWLLL